jgi:hypothetical protein
MNKSEIERLLNGQIVKIGRNQIHLDGELFIVEKYISTDGGEDVFEVYDGYDDIYEAIKNARILRP